jgi:hypothetical protein
MTYAPKLGRLPSAPSLLGRARTLLRKFRPSGRVSTIAVERCGNCRFWELSSYAIRNGSESGVGGHHCDGSVSNCRRHAPPGIHTERDRIHDRAEWPTTRIDAWCGEWEPRR